MVEDGREGRPAPARRHDRRADQRQHRRRAGPGGPAHGLPVRVRLPRQGQRGQAERAAGVRRRGRGLPDRGRAGGPALVLQRLRPAGPGDPRRVEARPVLATRTTRARTTRRPARSSGSRPTAGSPTSWPASAPAARSPASAGTSRRSPAARCGSSAPTRRARSTPAAPAGRTWSRASARTSGRRPTTATICDEIIEVSDKDVVRDDPPAGPRGGPAGRRLLRHGRGGGAGGGPPGRPGRRRRGAAARRRPRLPVQDLQRRLDGPVRLPAPPATATPRWPTCSPARAATCPTLVHVHPTETVRDAIDYMREYGVSQLPGAQGRAAGGDRRGGRLDRGEGPAGRAVHRPGAPARHDRAAHGRRRCR